MEIKPLSDQINEVRTAEAFSKQSEVFDALYNSDGIIRYKRARVRDHINQYLKEGDQMLELNCGTGEDVLYFAGKGFRVHATDISEGMLNVMKRKIRQLPVSSELCSFTQLEELQNKGPYQYIYSNFGGLNCTGKLDTVLQSLKPLIAPGGVVTLVIIPPFCLWETALVFKGKFRTAFRRFFAKNGRKARVEGTYFTCWYYPPSYIIKHLKKDFDLLSVEGLCTLVPPSYMEGFPLKWPRLFRFLERMENRYKASWPWKMMGDYYIISLRARSV